MNPILYYRLEGKKPIACAPMEWALWYLRHDSRRVKLTTVRDAVVSTTFLGIDYSFGTGKPLLFETMVFTNSDLANICVRYSTYEEAEEGHKKIVEDLRGISLKVINGGKK